MMGRLYPPVACSVGAAPGRVAMGERWRMNKASADDPPGRALAAGLRGVWPGMVALVVRLAASRQPEAAAHGAGAGFSGGARAAAIQRPLHTYELRRPQTWVVLDRRNTPEFGGALGDGARFFEPVTAADPDAGQSGKLWIEVLPAQPGRSPRQMLLQPFKDADDPPTLLARMILAPIRLGGVAGYGLVTLASRTQITLLLVRWRGRDYRLTIFGSPIPAEVLLALRTWRWVGAAGHPDPQPLFHGPAAGAGGLPGGIPAGAALRRAEQ